jgi:hypothetical protein
MFFSELSGTVSLKSRAALHISLSQNTLKGKGVPFLFPLSQAFRQKAMKKQQFFEKFAVIDYRLASIIYISQSASDVKDFVAGFLSIFIT